MTSVTSDNARRKFWTDYQPGIARSRADELTAEYFAEIEKRRYHLEPDILEMAAFETTAGHDVLDAGCGIATDGARFARAGANYTGVDFSLTALEHARARFALEGLVGRFVEGSLTALPFENESFDLVYSMGVVHHIPQTEQAIAEFRRVLRPGGRALVLVYHRHSFNYFVTILGLKRFLAAMLLLPGGTSAVAAATNEPPANLREHRRLLGENGLRYLTDRRLFLNNNTDGPGNPLSKVFSREEGRRLFADFSEVQTAVRFLHLRSYPGVRRIEQSQLAAAIGRRWGWHLWISARRPAGT